MPARRSVGARELKTRLGAYLRAVRGGETIVVTEREEAIAELRPLPRPRTDLDARLREMQADGLLSRGSGRRLPAFRAVSVQGRPLSDTIVEEREDRI